MNGRKPILPTDQPIYILGWQGHGHAIGDGKGPRCDLPISDPRVAETAHHADISSTATSRAVLENDVGEAGAQPLVNGILRLIDTLMITGRTECLSVTTVWSPPEDPVVFSKPAHTQSEASNWPSSSTQNACGVGFEEGLMRPS